MAVCLGAWLVLGVGTAHAQTADEGVLAGSEGRRPALISFTDSRLLTRLMSQGTPLLRRVGASPDSFRLQLILTEVNRDKKGRALLRHHTFGIDTSQFFYTASLVKLPTAALTLELLREQNIPLSATLHLGAASDCQAEDLKAYQPLPVNELIARSFVVSDNAAYNRLLELWGPAALSRALVERGYGSARIRHRYNSACALDPTGGLNPLSLRQGSEVLLERPARTERFAPYALDGMKLGGVDFVGSNFINLVDLHRMMLALYVPASMQPSERFKLATSDYRLLHRAMTRLPSEVDSAWFDTSYYHAARMKYLLAGGNADTLAALRADSVLIYNKVGLGYGFMTDCAYVVDFKRKREFFLSAVIYVNADGVVGDDKYEYESVGLPFLGALGRTVLAHERRRKVGAKPKFGFLMAAWADAPPTRATR